jgi:hypothetical protein
MPTLTWHDSCCSAEDWIEYLTLVKYRDLAKNGLSVFGESSVKREKKFGEKK